MPRLRTRVQLAARLRREYQLRNQTHVSDADIHAQLDTEYAWCWERLVLESSEDYGVTVATLVATPGQEWIALPADFSDLGGLRQLRRSVGGVLYEVTRSARTAEAAGNPTESGYSLPGIYWIEGPAAALPAVSRLVLRPVPTTAESLQLVYAQQAPVFVDDAAALDVWSEHVERALVALVATKVMARGDQANWQKAQADLGVALDEFGSQSGRRDRGGPNWVALHQRVRHPGFGRW